MAQEYISLKEGFGRASSNNSIPDKLAQMRLAQTRQFAERDYAEHLKNGGAELSPEDLNVFLQMDGDTRLQMLAGANKVREEALNSKPQESSSSSFFDAPIYDEEKVAALNAQAQEQAADNTRAYYRGASLEELPEPGLNLNKTGSLGGIYESVPKQVQQGAVRDAMIQAQTPTEDLPVTPAQTPIASFTSNALENPFVNVPLTLAGNGELLLGAGNAAKKALTAGYKFAKDHAGALATGAAAGGAALTAPMLAEAGGKGITATEDNKEAILDELEKRGIDLSTSEGMQAYENMLRRTTPEMLAEGKWGSSDRTWTDKAINTVSNIADWASDDAVKAGATAAGLGAAIAFRKPILNAAKGVVSSAAKGTAKAINKPLALGTTSENLLKIGKEGGAIAADGKAQVVTKLAPNSTNFAAQNIKKATNEAEAFQSNYGINLTGQDKEFSKASLAFDTLARAKAEQAGTFGGASDTLSKLDKAMDSAANGADHAILKSAADDINAHIKQAEHIANGGKGDNTSLSTKTLFREPVRNADGTVKLGADGKPIYAQNEDKLNRFAQLLGYQDATDPAFADAIKSVRFTDASHAQANFESAIKTLADNINKLEIHEASTARKGLTKYFDDLRARAKQLYGIDIDPEIGALTAQNAGGKAYESTWKNAYHFRARNQYRNELNQANSYVPRTPKPTSTVTTKAEKLTERAKGIHDQRIKTVQESPELQTAFGNLQKAVEEQAKAAKEINATAATMSEADVNNITSRLTINKKVQAAKKATADFIKQHPEYTEEEVFKILKAKTGMTSEEIAALGRNVGTARAATELEKSTVKLFEKIEATADNTEKARLLNAYAKKHNLKAKELQKRFNSWREENGEAVFEEPVSTSTAPKPTSKSNAARLNEQSTELYGKPYKDLSDKERTEVRDIVLGRRTNESTGNRKNKR